ncbi:TetR family transcriptional regulator [Streptomyces sp. NPDC051642]|uniref:TetR/AcrR family transcriptional regulator n=1 Tax=Streptomyces sp. NPDC051642 TaxID=3154646 RepID=UPI003437572A
MALLQGALEAFATHGFEGMSLRELARRLQVSHALLTARFGSKEELWRAAVEHALAQIEQGLADVGGDDGLDDLAALREGIVRFLVFAAEHPEVGRILQHEGAIDSPRIHFVFERFVAPLRALAEARLDALTAAGRIRPIAFPTLHFLITHGGGAPFTSPVEAALLGAASPGNRAAVRLHAEQVADLIVGGLTSGIA